MQKLVTQAIATDADALDADALAEQAGLYRSAVQIGINQTADRSSERAETARLVGSQLCRPNRGGQNLPDRGRLACEPPDARNGRPRTWMTRHRPSDTDRFCPLRSR